MFLGGIALAAIPVVLHLVMRQQPRHLEFPALRFIQQRQDTNRRRLQLRHLLLLLLRVVMICLLALALARPRVQSTGVIGGQEAPVAAALIFDTLPRMDYRFENKTRLEVAREIGLWLLGQLPKESQVAILDAGAGEPVFQIDAGTAQQRLERLAPTSIGRPLAEVLDGALELLAKSDQPRKEIYLFTDLARQAWPESAAAQVSERFERLNSVGVYVIDVGVEQPQDFALGEVRLSAQVLARNSPLMLNTELSGIGQGGTRVVETYLLGGQGKVEKRSQESLNVVAGGSQPVHVVLGGLEPGTHQGYLRMVGSDNLAANDTRFFTVEVKPPWRILVAAGAEKPGNEGEQASEAEELALYLTEALAPETFRINGQARFECRVVPIARLADESLDRFAAVALLDPPPLTDDVWQQLGGYAMQGGGVAICLGPRAQVQEFNRPAPQELLPGTLANQASFPEGDVGITTDDGQHPLLAKFRPLRGSVPWDLFPVYRCWRFDKLLTGANTVVSLSNHRPALFEKPLGKGRVLTLTTPISEKPDVSEGERWNRLPSGFEPWPFVMLANEMMLYLVGSADSSLNYTAGQPAVLRLDASQRFPTYMLSTPRGDRFRKSPDAKQNSLVVTSTDWPGNYRVQAGGDEKGVDRGFSVNLPQEATQLERIEREKLATFFGKQEYRVAKNREEINRAVSRSRVGRELFPLLLVAMVFVMAIEHLLANRFYRE